MILENVTDERVAEILSETNNEDNNTFVKVRAGELASLAYIVAYFRKIAERAVSEEKKQLTALDHLKSVGRFIFYWSAILLVAILAVAGYRLCVWVLTVPL